jgi:hypothetical protein
MRWIGVPAMALLAWPLANVPALAQGDEMQFAGTVGAGWSDYLLPGQRKNTSDWLASGSAVLTVDNPGFNVQANFNNSAVEMPKQSADTWSFGGDVYWRDYAGSVGFNVNFATDVNTGSTTVGAGHDDEENYGWFGQWFVRRDLTLQFKGGITDGRFEGEYGGAGVVFYPYQYIATSLTADYTQDPHIREQVRDATFTVEYLPVHDIPVSLYLGYDYSLVSQLPHEQVSVLLVGLKAYLGGGGRSGTLVEYQRNGATNWDGAPAAVLELGF